MDTGNSIISSGNTVSSLLNVNPQVNADVNALNLVNQQARGVQGVGIGDASSASGVQPRKFVWLLL